MLAVLNREKQHVSIVQQCNVGYHYRPMLPA
jgi:hypothetical protein